MSSSKEELEFNDVNSDDYELSAFPEYEIEQGSYASPSISEPSEDEEPASFDDEPVADAEWTAEYEKTREADKEMEKKFKYRLDGTISVLIGQQRSRKTSLK